MLGLAPTARLGAFVCALLAGPFGGARAFVFGFGVEVGVRAAGALVGGFAAAGALVGALLAGALALPAAPRGVVFVDGLADILAAVKVSYCDLAGLQRIGRDDVLECFTW